MVLRITTSDRTYELMYKKKIYKKDMLYKLKVECKKLIVILLVNIFHNTISKIYFEEGINNKTIVSEVT